MELEAIKYDLAGNVAVVVLNRPDALNALSQQLIRELDSALRMASDEGARAIVVTGEGRAYCSGGDLREMRLLAQKEGRIEAFLEEPLGNLHRLIRLMRDLPIPIVAAVNGVCAGAGVNLALACDIVFASDDAVFREAFVRIGLSPDCGGTFFLPRAVGEKLAAEMLMTGDAITAQRAAEIGMINRVVAADSLVNEAKAFASKLAAGPTGAIGRIKKMLNATFSNSLDTQLALEHECQIESGKSADFKEGVAAFFEKRPPNFSGK
jgi:2-(1,2-epoxy-1,2-dihydrophenyl)acetyl-CoA isomerase